MLSAALGAICAHYKSVKGHDFNPQLVTVDDSSLGTVVPRLCRMVTAANDSQRLLMLQRREPFERRCRMQTSRYAVCT
jgi:hypothetical protein